MLVRIRNLEIFERSVATPVNTSYPIRGNEMIEFEYPKAYDWFFLNMRKFNFYVEITSQLGDVTPTNPDLDFSDLDVVAQQSLKLLQETERCNDFGIHVAPDRLWVDEATYNAFKGLYEATLQVKQMAQTQKEVNDAVAKLVEAMNAFDEARQYGTSKDNELSRIARYGFSDDGLYLETLLSISDVRDNSFYVVLDKPLRDTDELVLSLTIDDHVYDTDVTVNRHPDENGIGVTTVGTVIVWSIGTSRDDTDVDRVDGVPSERFTGTWPLVPNRALLTVKTSKGEILLGVNSIEFRDRRVDMVKGRPSDTIVVDLNFDYLDAALLRAARAREGVMVSDDGDDVLPGIMWVTQDELDAFDEVVNRAGGLKGVVETQQEINDALEELEAAINLFESLKEDGHKGPYVSSFYAMGTLNDWGVQFCNTDETTVDQSEFRIVVRGSLNFSEHGARAGERETHYYLPLGFSGRVGRVVAYYDVDNPSREVGHVVIGDDESGSFTLPIDRSHKMPTFRAYKNEEVYRAGGDYQEYTVNCTQLTLNPEAPYVSGVDIPTGMYEERMYSELYDDLALSMDGNVISAEGSIAYIDDWAAYKGIDVHYFVPALLRGLRDDFVVKCYEPDNPDVELKHYVVNGDDVLVSAISPLVRTRKITVYASETNYLSDERGQGYVLDFSKVVLMSDANPVKGVELIVDGIHEGQGYGDLIDDPFEVSLDRKTHSIVCSGDVPWIDWPQLVDEGSGIHHFVPIRLHMMDGLVVAWFADPNAPSETTHFTSSPETRDAILELVDGSPYRKIVIYTSEDAHAAQADGIEYLIDCTGCNLLAKPFTKYEATDEDSLKDALEKEPDYDGNIHVEVTGEVGTEGEIVVTTPTVIEGTDGSTLSLGTGIRVLADLTVRSVGIESTSDSAIVVGDEDHTADVVLDSVTLDFTPEKAGPDGVARGLTVKSAKSGRSTATLTGCTVDAEAPEGGHVNALETSGTDSQVGGGLVVLEDTDVTVSGEGNSAVVVDAPHSEVDVNLGSTLTAKGGNGVVVAHDGKVQFDGSTVDAGIPVTFTTIAGCSTDGATADFIDGSNIRVTAADAETPAGPSAAIVFEDGTANCAVTTDYDSSVEAYGDPATGRDRYIGAFLGGTDNSVALSGTVRMEMSEAQDWFLHSADVGEPTSLYDATPKGDSIRLGGTAASTAFTVDAEGTGAEDRAAGTTVNASNVLPSAVEVAKAARSGGVSDRFAIAMGRFADDTRNDMRMPTGVRFVGYSEYVSIAPSGDVTVSGKRPGELQDSVEVLENRFTAQLSGYSRLVDFENFDGEHDRGHYVMLSVTPRSGTHSIKVSNGYTGVVDDLYDGPGPYNVILFVGEALDQEITITACTSDGNYPVKVDVADLDLALDPTELFAVAAADGQVLGRDVSGFQTNVLCTPQGDRLYELTGDLAYVPSWDEFSPEASGNFVALKFTPVEGVTLRMESEHDGPKPLDADGILVMNVLDDHRFWIVATRNGRDYRVAFDTTRLVRDDGKPKLTVVPGAMPDYYGHTADELQEGIEVGEDSISGTLRYVEDFGEPYPEDRRSGHFLVLDISAVPEESEITIQTLGDDPMRPEPIVVDDGYCVSRITDPEVQTIRLVATNGNRPRLERTYSLAGLVLEPAPKSSDFLTVSARTEEYWGKPMDAVQSGLTVSQGDDMNVALSGTLRYVPEWDEWAPGAEGHFAVIDVKPAGGVTKLVFIGRNTAEIDDQVLAYKADNSRTFTIRATDARGDHDVEFDLSGVELGEAPALAINVPDDSTTFYGHEASELQGDVEVSDDAVTGTLFWVSDMGDEAGFDPASGNFLALEFDSEGTVRSELVGGSVPGPVGVSDGYCVYRVSDPQSQTLRITAEGEGGTALRTLPLSGVRALPAPAFASVKIPELSTEQSGVAYSKLMSPETRATLTDDHRIEVEGELYRYDGWDLWGSDLQDKHYLVLATEVPEVGMVRAHTKPGRGDVTLHAYDQTADPTGDEWVVVVDEDHRTYPVTLYPDMAHAEAGLDGVEYTIDCSKVELGGYAPKGDASDYMTVAAATAEYLDRDPSTFQSGVQAAVSGMTVSISGTLTYVEDAWDSFQKGVTGHFVSLDVKPAGGVTKLVMKNEHGGNVTIDSDPLVVNIVDDHPFTVTATDKRGDHDVTFTVTGLELLPKRPTAVVKAPEGSETYYGERRADTLQTGVSVDGDAVTGNLTWTEYPEAFPTHPELQRGHYLALDLSAEPEGSKVEVELLGGSPVMSGLVEVDDGWCVFHVTDPGSQTIRVVATNAAGTSERTLDLTGLTLDPRPQPQKIVSVKAAGLGQGWKGVTYSSLMGPDFSASLGDRTIRLSGTLYRYDDWTAFSEDLRNKHYAVLGITVDASGDRLVTQKINGSSGSYTFGESKSEDFVVALDESHRTGLTYTLHAPGEEDNGLDYALDATDVTFDPKTKAEVDAAIVAANTPSLSTETTIQAGTETPTITLTSDHTFAASPTRDDLGLDFGETTLEFGSATGGSTSCEVTTTGTAAEGTIRARAKATAFEPSDGLHETAEVTITVSPIAPVSLESLDVKGLQEVARNLGIQTKATTKRTLISKIEGSGASGDEIAGAMPVTD